MKIRPASPDDIPAITDIYNEAILTTDATFDVEPKTIENRTEWLRQHGHLNPVVVAEQDGTVIGWASLSKWSDRTAYDNTVELSVYVADGCRNQGIGSDLMEAVLNLGEEAGLHTAISRIVAGNEQSLHLHEKLGFTPVGVMKEVGFKHNRLLDVHILQKMFANSLLKGLING